MFFAVDILIIRVLFVHKTRQNNKCVKYNEPNRKNRVQLLKIVINY
jgi:hypothetical protein